MKIRTLLTMICMAAMLHAAAEYPIYFRDANNSGGASVDNPQYDLGGHFDYPYVEGTRGVFDGKIQNGDPLYAEDGSITLTTNEGYSGGVYFRTKKLTEPCPMEYTIFAFEYKSNRQIGDVVVFQHEYNNKYIDIIHGPVFTVAEDYQTIFIPLTRNAEWGSEADYAKNYFWVSTNDLANAATGWQLTIKNLRMLTLEEAKAQAATAQTPVEIPELFSLPNTDFSYDVDADMENATVYVASGANPILQTSTLIKPLPSTHTTLAVDYKLSGADFAPSVYLLDGTTYAFDKYWRPSSTKFEASADPYTDGWKTAKFDISEGYATGWGQEFCSKDFVWLQCEPMVGTEYVLWIRNVRWINPNPVSGALEDSLLDQKPADNRIFNLMGVECRPDNLAPGIYIQNGRKIAVGR